MLVSTDPESRFLDARIFNRNSFDNGKQYVSNQLIQSLSSLGIRVLYAKPYSPQSKGGVEVFNRFVNSFLAEIKVQKVRTLEELNHYWDIWLESYYHCLL